MRRTLLYAAAGLLLAPLMGLVAFGSELNGTDVKTGKAPPEVKPAPAKPVKPVAKDKTEGTCDGDFGTSILFEESPKDAAALAKKQEKLVLVLHVSGHFEDPGLT